NPGFKHSHLPNFSGCHFKIVAINKNKVGPFSRLKTAQHFLAVGSISSTECKRVQGLLPAHPLFRIPAAFRLSLMILAGYGRIQSEKRIYMLNGEVRTPCNDRSLI